MRLPLALLLLAPSLAFAAAEEPGVVLRTGVTAYPIQHALVWEDASKSLAIEQLRELEAKGQAKWKTAERLNFGYTSARLWLKIPVVNETADAEQWIFDVGYPLLQVVHLHEYAGSRRVSSHATGKLLPFASRPIRFYSYAFRINVPSKTRTDVYVMVESNGTVFVPMALLTPETLLARSVESMTMVGVYCGIILAMVLYNLFLFFAIRDRNYLLYIVYALTFGLLMCSLNGISYQYLWPRWINWNKVCVPVLVGVSYLFLALFTESLLETRRLTPRFHAGLYAVYAGAAYLILGGVFFYGYAVNKFTSLFISLAPLVVLPISFRCLQLGSKPAVYYVIAFSCFFVGSATHAARDLAWLPHNFVTQNSPYWGSAAEMLLLSLGLAARMKSLKEEKLRSELQAAAVSALAAQVAHDIRSPLSALDVAARDAAALPEEARGLMRGAVTRIREIADGLTRKSASAAVEKLAGLIGPVLVEKRLEYRDQAEIEILDRLDGDAAARVQPAEFKRLLSNLINNAAEARKGKTRILVTLGCESGRVIMSVRDDGKGIAPALKPRLGRRGETHGKASGSGLGLHHARECAERWDGRIEIDSEIGAGTTISLILPRA